MDDCESESNGEMRLKTMFKIRRKKCSQTEFKNVTRWTSMFIKVPWIVCTKKPKTKEKKLDKKI